MGLRIHLSMKRKASVWTGQRGRCKQLMTLPSTTFGSAKAAQLTTARIRGSIEAARMAPTAPTECPITAILNGST